MIRTKHMAFAGLFALGLVACGDSTVDNNPDSGVNNQIVELSGEITQDTTWTKDKQYILTDLTYVMAPATLTVEAGTTVMGDPGSALVITRGAKIRATGTAAEPIVFTSSSRVGERRSGDWGGVVLLGAAPINVGAGENQVEGIDPSESRASYGGTDSSHECGALSYVRIEFAGFELSTDNELNGLTVAGCGSSTKLDYVQVHKGKDDGIEFFGGQPDAKHIVVTNAEDDSIDWDFGFRGRIQFLLIQQNPAEADAAFEADNQQDNNDASPRSKPTVYNATIIGPRGTSGTQHGLVLRRGTWGIMKNFILVGYPKAAIDIRDAAGVNGMMMNPPELTVESSLFNDNVLDFDDDADKDDDGAFDEAIFLGDVARSNQMSIDPMLPDAFNLAAPNAVPPASSPAATGGATAPNDGFFDASATYIGAFQPGGTNWAQGWTAFPMN
jgi:hypothetical protein